MAGDLEGVDQVLGYLFADNHLDDYRLEVVGHPRERRAGRGRSRERPAAPATGRITNDFVQVIRVADGRVSEVWNYHWDQRALAEAFPVAA